MPAVVDSMKGDVDVEAGLPGDSFVGAVKGARDPWWKRRRIVCPLILSVVGISAIALGVAFSLNKQGESGDSAVSSPRTDSSQSDSPSPAPYSAASVASSSSKVPTAAPSIEDTFASTSTAIDHMWRTTAPTGYHPRRPTISPAPTGRPTTSTRPTMVPPSPSPTVSPPPTEECYWVEIDIVYDSFPTETSWSIHSISPSGDIDLMKMYQEEDWLAMSHADYMCLKEGDYEFAIHDYHGDGMLAPGFYSLTSYGEFIGQGGADFGHSSTVTFSLPWTPLAHDVIYEYLGAERSEEHPPEHPNFVLDLVESVFEEEEVGVRD